MKVFQHKKIWLALVAALLIAAAGAAPAFAYFTTYVTAKGGYTLSLQQTTHIDETVKDFVKHITVHNDGDSESFIRVKAFCGSSYALEYAGSGWTLGEDDFWYYDSVVPAGGDTTELLVQIKNVPLVDAAAFNVIVVEESTAVLYKADGTPYADWNRKLAASSEEYPMEEAQ